MVPRRLLLLLVLSTFFVAAACYKPKDALTPEGSRVRASYAPPPNCTELGDVYGKAESSDYEKAIVNAKADIRNRAAKMDATDVVIDKTHDAAKNQSIQGTTLGHSFTVVLEGRALKCEGSTEGAPTAAPSAAPSSSAESAPTPAN